MFFIFFMFFLILIALLGILLFAVGYGKLNGIRRPLPGRQILLLFLAAAAVRLAAAALSKGFGSDTACFASWADRMFRLGPWGFYSPEAFTDYPPGYMYLLWPVGALRALFQLEYYSVPHLILLKFPAMACDLAGGMLLYREACKKLRPHQAFFICAAYLFNPAILLNSSVWGQVDSLFTLALLYMCLCLTKGRLPSAYAAFGIGILIKPQTLLFSPVLLAGFADWVLLKDFSLKNLFRQLFPGIVTIGGMVLLCLPFGLENVWNQYFDTVSSYPYATVNACNLWGLLGLNWVSQENTFCGIPYRLYGGFAIAALAALTLFLSFRRREDREKYPFLSAFLILTVFFFSVRMHERYLYPGLLLLLSACAYKPNKLTFLCYGGFSVMHFLNTANVLFFYDPADFDRHAPFFLSVSAGMLLCTVLLGFVALKTYGAPSGPHSARPAAPAPKPSQDACPRSAAPRRSRFSSPLRIRDFICMSAVTFVYGCFALYDLGDMQAPSTSLEMTRNQTIELDFQDQTPASLWYYIAPWHNRTFRLETKRNAAEDWQPLGDLTLKNVFTWQQVPLDGASSRLRFTLTDTQASLLEWIFVDQEGTPLTPAHASSWGALFDEADLFPAGGFVPTPGNNLPDAGLTLGSSLSRVLISCPETAPVPWETVYPQAGSFRNSMYFDEIYHGRTAYEYLHGLPSYENTHPPLGKILIALGISLFGMNPFGWRITGTLFGIAMVPVMYLFARRITRSTPISTLACLLFAFDFMHFAQTRIATIDVYVTFFILLTYYFMHQYASLSFYDVSLKRTWLPLGACGISMGLGIAAKWTGVYGGIGLALIFFSVLYRRYREYLYAKEDPQGNTDGISHQHILRSFAPCALNTVCFCLLFFVIVPAVIYVLSYIPFREYKDAGLLERMLNNQSTMFRYHSSLDATHPFSSPWYEWPVMTRPIWFYSHIVTRTASGGLREGISSFGNPAVWWAGIAAALAMICLWAAKKNRTAAFLTVGYLAQYLPWFFVTRITFIYHYFPSVPFAVLMIAYCLKQWGNHVFGRAKTCFYVFLGLYGALAFFLFLLFYPVLSGQPAESSYVAACLRWFQSWVLTAR